MATKKTVAVVGAAGFVGRQIVKALKERGDYNLVEVFRGGPIEEQVAKADVIVHAANPAKRFNAEKYPVQDFNETVEKTARFLRLAQGKRLILISSLSCRTQLDTQYGRHRRACELIALTGDSVIVRLGPMFGGNRKHDILHDILAGRPVYVSAETKYAYTDVSWIGHKIVELFEAERGIKEIGARNAVRLGDIAANFASTSVFSGREDHQMPEHFYEGPDANDVYDYAKKEANQLPSAWE
jgi:nucleoside-diphosphate-sugar epimerase